MKAEIEELANSVIDLSQCFAIWFEIVNAENKDARESIIQNYQDFFTSISASALTTYCITVYRLYDKRADVNSIWTILDLLIQENPKLKSKLETQIQLNYRSIEKINILRHKVFGHRDISICPELIFKIVGITPDQMKKVVELSQALIGQLLEYKKIDTFDSYIKESKLREECSQDDVSRLFLAL